MVASTLQQKTLRAEQAAADILAGIDHEAAFAEYMAAIDDDQHTFTGLAAIWDKAESAANIALTEGWHDPNGAGCSLSA